MENEKGLTKENFFNELYEKYPKAMQIFCNWIDEYKKSVNWNELFNDGKAWAGGVTKSPKFHELPYAIQNGIWIEFAKKYLGKDYFLFYIKNGLIYWLKDHDLDSKVKFDESFLKSINSQVELHSYFSELKKLGELDEEVMQLFANRDLEIKSNLIKK